MLQRLRLKLAQDPRYARILHGSVSGLVGRGLALLISAVTLPLTVRYLGALEYGIWVTVSTSVTMLSVLDLGIASTLTSLIAQAHAENDQAKAQRYFATAFWVTVGIVCLLAPLFLLLWHTVSWGSLFHLSDPVLIRHAAGCIAAAAAFFLLSLPLTLANRVLNGYQQVHVTNYFSMANSVFGLLAVLATLALHGSIVVLTVAYSGALLAGSIGLNLWLCFHQRPWIRPRPRHVSRTVVRVLFGQGFLFFLLQITGLVVFNSDNLVLAHYLGAAAVTPYSVAWRLTQYAALLQALLVPSLWPAFTEAYHKRQLDWMGRTYQSVRNKTLSLVGVTSLLIALFGRAIIRVWVGQAAVPPRGLLWLMAFFAFLMATTTNQALLLTATGRLRVEAGAAVLAAVVNLLLSIYLVQRIGPEGVILSTILSFLVCMVVPQEWEVRRTLAGRYVTSASAEEVSLA